MQNTFTISTDDKEQNKNGPIKSEDWGSWVKEPLLHIVHSAGTVEYTDWISAVG